MLHGGTLNNPPSKASIEGFAKGLSQIASVADATARAALVSGLTVTAANPVWVYRQDTGNVEMTEDGTTWKIRAAAATAPTSATLATNWGGVVKWARTGYLVTVHVAVQRTTSDLSLTAWAAANIATGLPPSVTGTPPGAVMMQMQGAMSNNAEVSAAVWALEVGTNGALNMQARWTARTFLAGTWMSGTVSYLTDSAV